MRSLSNLFRTTQKILGCLIILIAPSISAIHVDPPLDPADAKAQWRWIGVKATGTTICPHPGGQWNVQPLFGAELSEFCLYEYPPGLLPDTSLVTKLVGSGLLSTAQPDRMVVTHVGDPLHNLLWQRLAQHFDQHAGKTLLPIIPGAPKVKLVLLDTSPTSGNNPMNLVETSTHGATLQKFAESLLCDPVLNDCVAEIRSRLTLAYNEFNQGFLIPNSRNDTQGGTMGTIGELAEAIFHAVKEAFEGAPPSLRVILNLSVAWDGFFGGLEPYDQMPPDVQAVYRAIEWAACEGVLLVAAAGNRSDELGPNQGPMLPAAWAGLAPPPGGFCSGAVAQLIHAAGGVSANGQPLSNARPQSEPPLAAYADHAVIEDPNYPGTGTSLLTGSSVASLLVSASAAAVTYYRPDLNFDSVLSELYLTGEPLFRTADFCHIDSCPEVRFISLCAAVTHACQDFLSNCPTILPVCLPRPFTLPNFSDLNFSDFTVPPTVQIVEEDYDDATFQASPCGPNFPTFFNPINTPPTDPCPQRQRYGLGRKPWNSPQPNQDPCPSCLIDENGLQSTLYLAIDTSPNIHLSNPTLTFCAETLNPTTYSLNYTNSLANGDTLRLTGLPSSGCTAATISFTVNGSHSATSSLVLGQ